MNYYKVNLHAHTNDDQKDGIPYSFREYADLSKKLGFSAIAVTCHDSIVDSPEYQKYAEHLGILLITGVERTIEGSHVVILNPSEKILGVKTFSELAVYKKNNPGSFILAPHPFFFIRSLGKKLESHIHLFDAIELSWFFSKTINLNKRALEVARKHNLPAIATSDTHSLRFLDSSFAVVRAKEKSASSIFGAIRNNSFQNVSKPQNLFKMAHFFLSQKAQEIRGEKHGLREKLPDAAHEVALKKKLARLD